jgi:hypothetical protein
VTGEAHETLILHFGAALLVTLIIARVEIIDYLIAHAVFADEVAHHTPIGNLSVRSKVLLQLL